MIGCCIFCFVAVQVSAQIPTFTKGDNLLSLAIGPFSGSFSNGSGWSSTPYFTGYFETCIIDNLFDEKSSLGVGGVIGYKQSKYEYSYSGTTWGWKYTYLLFGARGALHYAFVDKLDTYAGLMLGFRVSSSKEIGTSTVKPEKYNGATSDLYAGARYYFTNNFGAFLELGYSWFSYVNLGVTIKF